MGPFGLKRNVMFPVYGLAEASLAVSFPDVDAEINTISANRRRLGIGEKIELVELDDINAMTFVTVGRPINECGVRIADIDGKQLADGFVGRILLKGKQCHQRVLPRGRYQQPDNRHGRLARYR